MEVFINENCLGEKDNDYASELVSFLKETIENLVPRGIKVYSRITSYHKWAEEWELDFRLKTRFLNFLQKVVSSPPNSNDFYYYHFSHQDFGLKLGDNITDNSLATAADFIQLNRAVLVLNFPGSSFSTRPHISIIKSPHNLQNEDSLAILPCFDSHRNIIQFTFVNERIRSQITDDKQFDEFRKAYLSFLGSFDFKKWAPKATIAGSAQLNPTKAFPASSSAVLYSQLSTWSIVRKSYEENVVSYRSLGGLVMEVHGYTHNLALSKHTKHMIYEAGAGNDKLIVSLDTENGGLEVLERDGTHIGTYGYVGNFVGKAKPATHSLNLPTHMFLF